MQIPRICNDRHHTGYYNINFNLDRIVMLLRKASYTRQPQQTCYVLCYVVTYTICFDHNDHPQVSPQKETEESNL
jgi:hypothetical protein